MPELPEVQTVVDELIAENIPGRKIMDVRVYWDRTVAAEDQANFCRNLKSRLICSLWRRGKYIVIDLDDGEHLLIHLRMTGKIYLTRGCKRRQPHEHVVIRLDDGRRLVFHDTRKFGRFYLLKNPEVLLDRLGPEPLGVHFTARILKARLNNHRRQIKPLLLDQSFIAGLGNIYVDEALWLARIHPLRPGCSLGWDEIKALHRSIRSVLRQGLRNAGTTLGNGKGNFVSPRRTRGENRTELKVFRRTGQDCPRCGSPVNRIIVGQRSTHFCRYCQIEPSGQ